MPSSLTSVARVLANNVFERTGAIEGTYVTATRSLLPLVFRRRRYMGVFGWTWDSRKGSDEAKSALEKGTAGRGVRRSEEMVTGSANRLELEVKSAKALWRASEAGERVCRLVSCFDRCYGGRCKRTGYA
jgi:hypothetical protein